MKELNIPLSQIKLRPVTVVYWVKPSCDRFKLNIDGSSLGNPGSLGAGGVIRDFKGDMVLSFFMLSWGGIQ